MRALLTMIIAPAVVARAAAGATTPYDVDLVVDVGATLGLNFLLGITGIVSDSQPFTPRCRAEGPERCDPKSLSQIDRYAVSKRSKTWRHVSDAGEVTSLALPTLFTIIDVALSDTDSPFADGASDFIVMAQAGVVAGVATQLVKVSVERPRPGQYDPRTYRSSNYRQRSFPSGHTTVAAVAATSYAATFWWRHPESPWRWAVAGAAVVWTGFFGWSRVEAGEHFPTDILAGAAIGATAGLVVPWIHRKESDLSLSVMPGTRGSPHRAALSLRF